MKQVESNSSMSRYKACWCNTVVPPFPILSIISTCICGNQKHLSICQSQCPSSTLPHVSLFALITIHSFPHSWPMTWLVKRVTQQVPIMEQELPALPEHMNSPPIFVVQSLVYSVVFYRSLFVFFSFGHLDHLVLRPN